MPWTFNIKTYKCIFIIPNRCTLKLYTHLISLISRIYAYLIFLLTYCCVKFVEKFYDFILNSLEPSLARLVICFRNST